MAGIRTKGCRALAHGRTTACLLRRSPSAADVIRVERGDCREMLTALDADSVHACVTDPPYHLTTMARPRPDLVNADNPYARRQAKMSGFMGKDWDGGDIAFQPDTWRAVLRVLKPGGFMVCFASTRGYHRMVCAIEDAGFIIHPMLAWIFASGFPKATRLQCEGTEGLRYGLQALKPAIEPICMAQKPMIGTGTQNWQRFGTGALNIDASRIPAVTGQLPDDTFGEWEREQRLCASCVERAEQSGRQEAPATKASTATRHAEPTSNEKAGTRRTATSRADIGCSDGMTAGDTSTSSSIGASGRTPTVQSQTDTTFTTSTATSRTTGSRTCAVCGLTITTKNTGSTIHARMISQPGVSPPNDPATSDDLIPNGSSANGHEDGKKTASSGIAGRWPSNILLDGSPEVEAAFAAFGERSTGDLAPYVKQTRSGMPGNNSETSTFARNGDSGSASRFFYSAKADASDRADSRHPTVKPVDLMRYLVRLVTPPGGTVLDPFAGSGTTAEACMLEGFDALLIEQDAQHIADIRHRIRRWSGLDMPLFAQVAAE